MPGPWNPASRHARIKAIHAARRSLGLDEDTYRDLIDSTVPGKRSCSDLTVPQLDQVLTRLNQSTGRTPGGHHAGRPKNCDARPLLRKIEALLADQKLPWAYLTRSARGPSMCRRLAGVDALEFASDDGLRAIVTALAKRQNRAERAL
mgnify:CR=1 FL=1